MGKQIKTRTDLPPLLMQYSAATNPLYQHFLPLNQREIEEPKNVLLDLAKDTKKIAQVLPLMNKTSVHQLSNYDYHPHEAVSKTSSYSGDIENDSKNRYDLPLMNSSSKHKLSSITVQPERSMTNSPYYNSSNSINKADKTQLSPEFLTVQHNNLRANSAEYLIPKMSFEELRRTSSGNTVSVYSYRRPGTGRKLPSTEQFEKPNNNNLKHCLQHDLPQIIAPIDDESLSEQIKRRRTSFLPRCNAIDNVNTPRKQNSSPLPNNNHKMYDRDHHYSRSLNVDNYDNAYYDTQHSSNDLLSPILMQNYHQIPIQHAPPRPPPIKKSFLKKQNESNQNQAKSFDMNLHNPFENNHLSIQRSLSEKDYIRQITQQMLQPETEISQQCQDLWNKRKTLADKNELQQLSTDLSDDLLSAASTSFESNTESILQNEDSKQSNFLELPRKISNAQMKRQKYKNLLLYRNSKNEMFSKQMGQSSIDSVGTDSTSDNKIIISSDSNKNQKNEKNQLMTYYIQKPSNAQKQIINRTLSAKYVPVKSHSRNTLQTFTSFELERDYSVDSKSDTIFRSFSKIDPLYERHQKNHVEYPKHFNPNQRRKSPQMMKILSQYKSADNSYYHY